MAWLINQAKPSQAKPSSSSSFLAFPRARAQAQTLFLGLSQAQVKFKLDIQQFKYRLIISLYVLAKYTHYTYLNNNMTNMRPLPILP